VLRNIILWGYFLLYAGINMADFFDPETRGGAPEFGLNVLLFLIGSTGLIAYILRITDARMIAAWKVVAPMFLIGQIAAMVLFPIPQDPALSARDNGTLAMMVLALVSVVLAPLVAIHFRFAAGKHLLPAKGAKPRR
jgi:hypothetical protein